MNQIKVITVASPDKIALSMFVNFINTYMGEGFKVGTLHSLMSTESAGLFALDFLETNNGKAIFSYYAKRKANKDPKVVLPSALIEKSDVVVWFNLYSTKMDIVKDECGFADLFSDRWNKSIENMEKIQI